MCGCMLVWCLDARLMCILRLVRDVWCEKMGASPHVESQPSSSAGTITLFDEIWYHTYRLTSFVFATTKRTCLLYLLDGLQSEIPSGRNPGESYGYPEVLEQCNLPGN